MKKLLFLAILCIASLALEASYTFQSTKSSIDCEITDRQPWYLGENLAEFEFADYLTNDQLFAERIKHAADQLGVACVFDALVGGMDPKIQGVFIAYEVAYVAFAKIAHRLNAELASAEKKD